MKNGAKLRAEQKIRKSERGGNPCENCSQKLTRLSLASVLQCYALVLLHQLWSKIRDCCQSSLIRNFLTLYAFEVISLIVAVDVTCVLNEALHDKSLFNRCVSRTWRCPGCYGFDPWSLCFPFALWWKLYLFLLLLWPCVLSNFNSRLTARTHCS